MNADSRFSTTEPLEAFLKFDLPGVEGLHEIHAANHDLFVNMLRSKLTQHSAFLNEALMEEAATAFDENWGTSQGIILPSIAHCASESSTNASSKNGTRSTYEVPSLAQSPGYQPASS